MRSAWLILGLLVALVSPTRADVFGVPPPFLLPQVAQPAAACAVNTACASAVMAGAACTSTTPDIDTTGATFIGVNVGAFGQGTRTFTFADNKGNTYTPLTIRNGPVETSTNVSYALNPTVGPGHHFTFTATTCGGSQVFASGEVVAIRFSVTPTFDKQNGGSASALTTQTGSVTPTNNNSLLLTGMTTNAVGGTASIDSGFTISGQVPNTVSEGTALAWKILGTAAATNPTWTTTGPSGTPDMSAAIGVFAP